jgi:hypothetical protein
MRTVRLLRDFAFFGECEEDLLRRCLWDGALEVGGDVDSTVWTVNLTGTSKMILQSCEFTHPLDVIEDLVLRYKQ